MAYIASDPFSVCFNMMKMRYHEYDQTIDSDKLNLEPSDPINVFINFESVMTYLSTVQDIDHKLEIYRDAASILTSGAMNLIAHYRRFFREYNMNVKVFLYMTALDDAEQDNEKFIDDYRTYYQTKFTSNPKFSRLGDIIRDQVVPNVKSICKAIDGVYFLTGSGIEGSLIPLIVNEFYEGKRKNFLISNDLYDVQFQAHDNFIAHIMRRSNKGAVNTGDIITTMNFIMKTKVEKQDLRIFENPAFYRLMIACLGDRKRYVEGIRGYGPLSVYKAIRKGISENIITPNTTEIELLSNLFSIEMREEITKNYRVMDLDYQLRTTGEDKKFYVTDQIVDHPNLPLIQQLQSTILADYPLMLQELTC